MNTQTAGGFLNRLRTWFPEREFFMRSQGQVRFVTITSRMQMIAAGLALAALLGWGISMSVMAVSQYRASSEIAALQDREIRVASAEETVDAYREDIDGRTATLEKRQDILEAAAAMLPDDVVSESETAEAEAETAEFISQIETAIPEAVGLARFEARQLAFVGRLTRFADRRADRAERAIRTLGLDPRMLASGNDTALGGPLEILESDADGSLDARFAQLALSLSRMDALERGLNGIPQVMPADVANISSGFGYRRDPFNGGAAMHSGLDFRGPRGAPIHAAADGSVSFVGNKAGYGRVVEITHGNGMMTRYAHMSRWNASEGQRVAAGDMIGTIGSTGRSTGPHLHFEVRINGRAVNPRPFLESAPHVLEEARAEEVAPVGDASDGE